MPFYSTPYCKYYNTCLIKENNNNGIKAGNEKISSLRKSPVSQYGVVVHIISLATFYKIILRDPNKKRYYRRTRGVIEFIQNIIIFLGKLIHPCHPRRISLLLSSTTWSFFRWRMVNDVAFYYTYLYHPIIYIIICT